MSIEANSQPDFFVSGAKAAALAVSGTAALSAVSAFATPHAACLPRIGGVVAFARSSIATVVCIPCFRRPQHLRLTLESLADQRTDRRFAVVIVENDALACGSVPVAAEFLASGKFPGLCVVEPRQGNCHAINAAFETALATFPAAANFLMIDDDEIASPDWLELMVRAAEVSGRGRGRRPGAAEFRGRHQARASAAIRPSVRPMTRAVRCRSSMAAATA